MTIGDYGSYISSAGCNIGGFGGVVNGAGVSTLIDAVFASGAGTVEANGLYIPNGTINSRTRYTKVDVSASFAWDGTQYRLASGLGGGDIFYYTTNGPINPWSGTYLTSGDGAEPVPTVRQATTADS
jgi:hypothetical protein